MRNALMVTLSFLLFSCTSSKQKNIDDVNTNLDQVNKSFADNRLDTAAARKSETSITQFIQKYPQDSLSSKYLFELGMLYQKQRKFDKAISTFDRVYTDYPGSKEAHNAVFLEGFLYANVLNQLEKAKEKYQLYLNKYSDVDAKMTNDVKLELDNLGKSADELLKELQDKASLDSMNKRS